MARHEIGRGARYDAAALCRLADWIGDDLRVWAYARRREQNWIVSVPAFSIVTGDASLEAAFDQSNALMVDRLMACLDAHVVIDRSWRPLPRRVRAAIVLDAVLAEATGAARRRPPRVQRVLVTSRSLNLLPAPSLAMIQERLETIRRRPRPSPLAGLLSGEQQGARLPAGSVEAAGVRAADEAKAVRQRFSETA